jgi:hypothetical protein
VSRAPAPGHPVRYLTDGTATTRRVRYVRPAEFNRDSRPGVVWFDVFTSWAGETTPRKDLSWAAVAHDNGEVGVSPPRDETPQQIAGVKRRVRNALARMGDSAPVKDSDSDSESEA